MQTQNAVNCLDAMDHVRLGSLRDEAVRVSQGPLDLQQLTLPIVAARWLSAHLTFASAPRAEASVMRRPCLPCRDLSPRLWEHQRIIAATADH